MDTAPITAATPPAAQPKKTDAAAGLASDFDTFLTLLTAQIKNQDPLNPQDATQYSTQLATFSNVEQGVRTNALLEDLIGRIDGQGLADLASWIGMEARTTAPALYEGGAVTLEATLPPFADAAEMIATTPDGTEAARFPVDANETIHTVTPTAPDGAPLAPGTYGFTVQPYGGGGTMQPVAAARYAAVREARVEDGATILVLDGGVRLDAQAVVGLRPGGADAAR